MIIRLILSFFCLLCFTSGYAQIQIHAGGEELHYADAGIQYAFIEGNDFSDSLMKQIPAHRWKPFTSSRLSIGFKSESLWLKIPLNKIAARGSFEILEIKNPHINFLKVWVCRNDTIVKSFPLTGDHLPFTSKSLPERIFSFPLSTDEHTNDTLIIAAEKRNTTFKLEIDFSDQQKHLQTLQTSMIYWGLMSGLAFMLLIINMYLFFSSKEWVYCWYGLYLFFFICYIGTDTGLFFEYLYPNAPQINDLIRPLFFTLCVMPLILFYSTLLNLSKYLPRLYRINAVVLIIYIIVFFIAFATCLTANPNVYQFWLKIQSVYTPTIFLLLLAESVYCVWLRIPFASFALTSFFVLFFFVAILSMGQNDVLPANWVTNNAHYIGMITDALIVAFSLVYRYKIFKRESDAMRKKYIQQQEKIFHETSVWQQQEMERMSSLLHDSIGGDIGMLRLKTETMELTEEGRNKLSEFIHKIGDEVRYMSHHFSPILLKERGLYDALQEIVQRMKEDRKISVQFEWVGDKESPSFKYQIIIYRIIQELLQNVKKHAKATEVIVQIMMSSATIGIYVEDNGQGQTQANNIKDGIGLKSIRHLTELLNGKFEVSAGEEHGFVVSVEFERQ
jgi:signal transduction histidine kinase